MTIFISYSHSDKDFVDRLTQELVHHRAHIWIDRWELGVGDSIIDRIQIALQNATAILVVLSRSSVESEWCKKEIAIGVAREIEEKRIVLLPILIENCNIPAFLKDKKYADFRGEFAEGLKEVLSAIEKTTNTDQGRVGSQLGHIDWAIDRHYEEDLLRVRIIYIETLNLQPYCILTEIEVVYNDSATRYWKPIYDLDLGFYADFFILLHINIFTLQQNIIFTLDDQRPMQIDFTMRGQTPDQEYKCKIISRWIGQNTGGSVRVDISGQIKELYEYLSKTIRKLTPEEEALISKKREID